MRSFEDKETAVFFFIAVVVFITVILIIFIDRRFDHVDTQLQAVLDFIKKTKE